MPRTGRSLWLAVALATMLVAGCITTEDDEESPESDVRIVPDDWWVDSVPSSATHAEHDHRDHSHHAGLTTANFETVGYDPLVTEQHGETVPGMMCGGATTRDDGRRLAVVHSIAADMAVMVADVTDPKAPFLVGEFYMPNAVTWDADITAEGMHAVVGAYPVGAFGGEPTLPEPMALLGLWKPEILFRNACTNEMTNVGPENYVPFGPGVVLIDIADPETPVFADWRPQPVVGPHSVGSHLINGEVIVTASVTNLLHEGSYYSFFRIASTPTGSVLEPYAQIRVPGLMTLESNLLGLQPWLNGHVDVWVHEHPLTGQVIAYLANWDGMYVYDLSDPLVPMELAVWKDGDLGSVHTTYPFPELVDGRQLLVVAQEVSEREDRPTGWVYILDVTDPAAPAEVGRWTLPVKPSWDDGGLQFSTHYARVLDETMFVAVNHAGLWALDVSNPADPRAIGVFVPDRPSPAPFGGNAHAVHVGDVAVDLETGIITTWDGPAGIYQLRFHADVPVEPAPAWGEE